jgi:hypothetical protein
MSDLWTAAGPLSGASDAVPGGFKRADLPPQAAKPTNFLIKALRLRLYRRKFRYAVAGLILSNLVSFVNL